MDQNLEHSLDRFCTSIDQPWSIITSSASNAQLAAILAGFMITAITFVLNKNENASSPTIALFFSGVLVLGLDSYIFGTISAPAVDKDGGIKQAGEYVCSLSWSQGMAASGMLGVGAVLMVSGLAWMVKNHVEQHRKHPKWANETRLIFLGNFLIAITIATTMVLLARTSVSYFYMMHSYFKLVTPRWVTDGNLYRWSKHFISLCCALILMRTFGLLRFLSFDYFRRRQFARRWQVWLIGFASTLTAFIALAGPVFASRIAQYARERPGDVPTSIWALRLALFIPQLVFLAISLSVPGAVLLKIPRRPKYYDISVPGLLIEIPRRDIYLSLPWWRGPEPEVVDSAIDSSGPPHSAR